MNKILTVLIAMLVFAVLVMPAAAKVTVHEHVYATGVYDFRNDVAINSGAGEKAGVTVDSITVAAPTSLYFNQNIRMGLEPCHHNSVETYQRLQFEKQVYVERQVNIPTAPAGAGDPVFEQTLKVVNGEGNIYQSAGYGAGISGSLLTTDHAYLNQLVDSVEAQLVRVTSGVEGPGYGSDFSFEAVNEPSAWSVYTEGYYVGPPVDELGTVIAFWPGN